MDFSLINLDFYLNYLIQGRRYNLSPGKDILSHLMNIRGDSKSSKTNSKKNSEYGNQIK